MTNRVVEVPVIVEYDDDRQVVRMEIDPQWVRDAQDQGVEMVDAWHDVANRLED